MKLKRTSIPVRGSEHYFGHSFNCPGCGFEHMVKLEGENPWTWNHDVNCPSLSPSIKVQGVLGAFSDPPDPTPYLCHSYIVQGRIQFLDDCTHSLRGWHDLPPYVRLMD